ncbi:MAG: class I SAM-dependent DNA methyltransferase, partial [Spirochaetes bacterium]|nr:class I SAM-dependent DNA methyltransferase [Spirochaetota bacterium]
KFYIEATGFIMTGKNLKYICGLLNSKPVAFFFKKFYAGGGLGEDVFRYKKAFLEKLPIPEINNSNRKIVAEIEKLVDEILKLKSQNPSEDTSECEKKIDELVYQLYELTPDEIKIIEENNS